MSNKASQQVSISEADFEDSQPLTSQPLTDPASFSVGDLSAMNSELNSIPEMEKPSDAVDSNETNNSDVLGDITLLEEAYAELDGKTEMEDDDIPVLDEAVEPLSTIQSEAQNTEDSDIPVLNDQASILSEMLIPVDGNESVQVESKEAANSDILSASMDLEEIDLEAMDEGQSDLMASGLSPESNSLASNDHEETTFSMPDLSELDAPADLESVTGDSPNAMDTVVTTFEALDDESDELENPNEDLLSTPEEVNPSELSDEIADIESNSSVDTVSQVVENNETISDPANFDVSAVEEKAEEKVETKVETSVTASEPVSENITSDMDIHEIPISYSEMEKESSAVEELDVSSSMGLSDFAADLTDNDSQIPKSELMPSSYYEEPKSAPTPPQPETRNFGNSHLNISYELHAQLSRKIDALVIDATTSLTNELHTQLNNRLESLLGHAVESVLPRLVDQMANELRHEVNVRVKQQLPLIINDVLGSTRMK